MAEERLHLGHRRSRHIEQCRRERMSERVHVHAPQTRTAECWPQSVTKRGAAMHRLSIAHRENEIEFVPRRLKFPAVQRAREFDRNRKRSNLRLRFRRIETRADRPFLALHARPRQ